MCIATWFLNFYISSKSWENERKNGMIIAGSSLPVLGVLREGGRERGGGGERCLQTLQHHTAVHCSGPQYWPAGRSPGCPSRAGTPAAVAAVRRVKQSKGFYGKKDSNTWTPSQPTQTTLPLLSASCTIRGEKYVTAAKIFFQKIINNLYICLVLILSYVKMYTSAQIKSCKAVNTRNK